MAWENWFIIYNRNMQEQDKDNFLKNDIWTIKWYYIYFSNGYNEIA